MKSLKHHVIDVIVAKASRYILCCFSNLETKVHTRPISVTIFIPPLHRRWNGGILDSYRCLSVRSSIDRTQHLKKTIGYIHFIPGIYPYVVSLLTHIYFRVPGLTVGPLVAKYLAESGVSGTFWKNVVLTLSMVSTNGIPYYLHWIGKISTSVIYYIQFKM